MAQSVQLPDRRHTGTVESQSTLSKEASIQSMNLSAQKPITIGILARSTNYSKPDIDLTCT
jgi:hypothetical protein